MFFVPCVVPLWSVGPITAAHNFNCSGGMASSVLIERTPSTICRSQHSGKRKGGEELPEVEASQKARQYREAHKFRFVLMQDHKVTFSF